MQTRDGYIWLATQEGLVRFDGIRFTVFDKRNTPQIKGNNIQALYEDREGKLWVGTSDGLSRMSGEKFVSYAIPVAGQEAVAQVAGRRKSL